MGIEFFEELDVWKKSDALVLKIYRVTQRFPDCEKYGLQSQMRRAAVSVPANIAEGFKRRGAKERLRFFNFAQSSLEELRYYLMLCQDLRYVDRGTVDEKDLKDIARMLTAIMNTTRT